MRFSNLNYASEIAARYIDFLYLTVLQQWLAAVQFIQKSVDAFFKSAAIKNMCVCRRENMYGSQCLG